MPARDEAQRIATCLGALRGQRGLDGAPLGADTLRIVVLANNCSDETAAVARASGGLIEVIEVALPPPSANAGGARRAAMDVAAARLPDGGGLICTTDADSRPRPDWIARLWQAVDAGAEAVAGAVDFDPCEFDPCETAPPAFSRMRQMESEYAALQAEITARADPQPHDPWPNHIWAWGANMAVTASAYRRVGGLPPAPLAEDRAFLAQLRRHDVPVRHCLQARVWTSARCVGRAPGGLASLVSDHTGLDAQACDAALEPARIAWRRAIWRKRLRRAYVGDRVPDTLAARLQVHPDVVREALNAATFGAAWSRIEAASSGLTHERLHPGDLACEIGRALRLLARIKPCGPADQADRVRAASAGLWSTPAPSP